MTAMAKAKSHLQPSDTSSRPSVIIISSSPPLCQTCPLARIPHVHAFFTPYLFKKSRHRSCREIRLESSPKSFASRYRSRINPYTWKDGCHGVNAYISASSVGSDHFRPRKLRPKGMPSGKTPSGTVVTGYLMSAPSTSASNTEELT